MPELCRGPEAVAGRLPAAGVAVLGCDRLSTARSSGACTYAGAFVCAQQPGESCSILATRRGVQLCWAAIGCLPPAHLEPADTFGLTVPGSLARPAVSCQIGAVQQCWAAIGCNLPARLEPVQVLEC